MNYELDTKAAREADSFESRIDSTGKYTGTFTYAYEVTSKKGTKGIEFSFKSDEGKTADYLTIWTVNKDGEFLPGFKTVNALMTCVKARSLNPVKKEIEKFDFEQKKKVKVTVDVFPEIMSKKVGLLLQREEYISPSTGELKNKLNIYMPFEASTGFTAKEILDKAVKPESMEKALMFLGDRHAKKPAQQAKSQAAPFNDADFDDGDIPF